MRCRNPRVYDKRLMKRVSTVLCRAHHHLLKAYMIKVNVGKLLRDAERDMMYSYATEALYPDLEKMEELIYHIKRSLTENDIATLDELDDAQRYLRTCIKSLEVLP